jgi:peptide/nickel transport system permease protein
MRYVAKILDSDAFFGFRSSPATMIAAASLLAMVFVAVFTPLIAPHNPFDISTVNLLDSEIPPLWLPKGDDRFLLGTDTQGRDMLSSLMFGLRISLIVGVASVILSLLIGVSLGLASGYFGGFVDAVIMRAADVKLTFPPILVALLVDGVARGILGEHGHEQFAVPVVIISIGISGWVQYARTVRGAVLVERQKDYVSAAKLVKVGSARVLISHILPNVSGPVLVIATINLGLAVLTEATLSFLGVGVPSLYPSLGTLIRIGNEFLFSGLWWITLFPAFLLVVLVLSVNVLGDWLRDVLNPKLR